MDLLNNMKALTELIKKYDNSDLNHKMHELDRQINDVIGENSRLKESVKALTDQLDQSKQLHYEDNAYYLIQGNDKEGPYCSKCWDSSEKLMHLQTDDNVKGRCPLCNDTVVIDVKTYNENISRQASYIASLNDDDDSNPFDPLQI